MAVFFLIITHIAQVARPIWVALAGQLGQFGQ